MKIKLLRLTFFVTAFIIAFALLNFVSHRLVQNGALHSGLDYQTAPRYGKGIRRVYAGENHVISWRNEDINGDLSLLRRKQNRLGGRNSDNRPGVKATPSSVLMKRLRMQTWLQTNKGPKNEKGTGEADKIAQEPVTDRKRIVIEGVNPRNGTPPLRGADSTKKFSKLRDRYVTASRQVKENGEKKSERFADRPVDVRQGFGEELPVGGTIDEAWLLEREEEFARRREVVEKVCGSVTEGQESSGDNLRKHLKTSGLLTKPPKMEHFLMVRSASSLTCPINKAASTSMALALLKAENLQPKTPPGNQTSPHPLAASLRPKSELEFSFARKYFLKFVLVRHPFERLLSAYRDKVVKAQDNSLLAFRNDISECMKQLREENITNALQSPTEESSLEREYRLATIRENHRNKENEKRKGKPYDRDDLNIPSFNDFLRYILYCDTHSNFASHWLPYWSWCAPCQIKFDVIAKLETAAEDFKYLWHRLGLITKQEVPWQNSSTDKLESSRLRNLAKYYSTLDPATIYEVYQKYRPDFELFEYDIRDVLRVGGHCTWRGEVLC